MTTLTRFECASSSLVLSGLLRRARRVLWGGLGVAAAAHLSLLLVRGLGEEQQVAKPLTTQFVKRQPRLTKPLELKKRPQPKRRQVQREMVAVRARAGLEQTGVAFVASAVLGGLAGPRVSVARIGTPQADVLEPQAVAEVVGGQKEARGVVDMSLEMIDTDALDTGRYRAMVIQDPTDKRQIKGFLHLASAYPVTASLPPNEVLRWPNIIQALVGAMNRFTSIRADFQGRLTFDSAELLTLPFLYTRMYWAFHLSESESSQLGYYLVQGGFLFAETLPPGGGYVASYEPVKGMIGDALNTQHIPWSLERLPNSHGVYHCYFDFDGPPVGTEAHGGGFLHIDYLEGAISAGRVLAIICQKNYAAPWCDWGILPSYKSWDSTRQLQFAVNVIVFALTQEGSITHRLMESVR